MNEDWNCLGEESKDPYSQVCIEAVENDKIFNNFKKIQGTLLSLSTFQLNRENYMLKIF